MTSIGAIGVNNIDLVIPQGTSLSFTVPHEEDGEPVDHTSSTVRAAIQDKVGNLVRLDGYCTGAEGGVHVEIPASVSADLALKTKYVWDLIAVEDDGSAVRLAYGDVSVVDTYALDDDPGTSDADATAEQVLEGYVAYANGERIEGAMPDLGGEGLTVATLEGASIPEGYRDGTGTAAIDADEAAKVIPANIREGVTVLGVEGALEVEEREFGDSYYTVYFWKLGGNTQTADFVYSYVHAIEQKTATTMSKDSTQYVSAKGGARFGITLPSQNLKYASAVARANRYPTASIVEGVEFLNDFPADMLVVELPSDLSQNVYIHIGTESE